MEGGLFLKKLLICLVIFAVITLGLLYYRYFSMTSVLNNQKFSKSDILLIEEYTTEPAQFLNIFLLADSGKIGLVLAEKNKYGLWDKQSISSIAINPSNDEFVTLGFARIGKETNQQDFHIFIA